MRSKRLPTMAIVVAVATTVGCGDNRPQQRDVYKSKEACLKDWKDPAKCEKMTPQEQMRSGGGSAIFYHYYWGPHYYSGHRYTPMAGGGYYAPPTQSASRSAFSGPNQSRPQFSSHRSPVTTSVPSIARPVSSPNTGLSRPTSITSSRGGFGATGRGVSSGT